MARIGFLGRISAATRTFAWGVSFLVFGLTSSVFVAGSAQAQRGYSWGGYPSWYGWGLPYGWNGWGWGFGGANTVPGSILGGWGYYLNGLGYYNYETAVGNAINLDSWLRLAAAMNDTQMQLNYSNYQRRLRRHANILTARQKIFERLRDDPNDYDVKNGDAANVKMRILMKPGYSGRVAAELNIVVLPEVLDQLVFLKSSEGVSLSLKDLNPSPVYPSLLQQQRFTAARSECERAWAQLIHAFESSAYVETSIIREVSDSLQRLRAQVDAEFGRVDQNAYNSARSFIKTRQDTVRAFSSETLTGFISLMKQTEGLTIGKLLEAMTVRGMQFYPARDPEQTAVYERFYAVLRGAPSTILSAETFSAVFDGSETP